MAISLKHLFQSAKTDGPDNTIVQPSDWNDEHVLTQATNRLLGRTTAGTGATEEIAPGTGITLSAGTLSADVTSVAGRTGAVTLSTADISGLTTGYVQKTSATGSAYLPAGTTGQREGSPSAGYIRYNTTTGKFEGYGSAWGNIGGGAAIGDTPPANPGAGDLWWNSADGRMYVYYTDANSSQWVDLSAGGAGQYLPLTGGDVTGNVTVTGNFGVGITTPSYPLVVNTTATSTSIGANIITRLQSNGAGRDVTLQFSDNTAHSAAISMAGGNLAFANYGTERMRIDASGRVTMPFQPMCYVGHQNLITYAVNGIVQWGAIYDPLTMFNSSNNRITVPVSGRYLVMADLLVNATSAGGSLSVNVRRNGINQRRFYSSSGFSYQSASLAVILNCSANDYIDFQNTEAATIYGGDIGNATVILLG